MKIIISLLIIIFLSSPILCYGATQEELELTINELQLSMDNVHEIAEDLRRLNYKEDSEELITLKSLWGILNDEQETLIQQLEELKEEEKVEEYIGIFSATAYCHQCSGSTTSTGVKPTVGTTIAVDPRVIPYGTTLRLEDMDGNSLGYRIAQDTGGAIKGNKLDLYLSNNKECINWGRRKIKVFIVN